jgi:hypothetical protein
MSRPYPQGIKFKHQQQIHAKLRTERHVQPEHDGKLPKSNSKSKKSTVKGRKQSFKTPEKGPNAEGAQD